MYWLDKLFTSGVMLWDQVGGKWHMMEQQERHNRKDGEKHPVKEFMFFLKDLKFN